jgi:hypothetical protein
MMRTAFVVMLLALAVTPAYAGGGIGVTGSWWDTSEAGDDVGWGIIADLSLTAQSPVDLELRYASIRELTGEFEDPLFTLDVEPIEIGVSYNFNRGGVNPYLGGGFGFYMLRATRLDSAHDLDIQDENGWYLVGGVDLPIGGHWALLGEVMYRSVKSQLEGEGLADFDVLRVDLSGAAANVGFVWRW